MHASDEWTNTQAMIVSRRCDLCCRSTVFQRSRRRCRLHRFTHCHPEAIFDVNKRLDMRWGCSSLSTGRMLVWSPAIPLRTQFGAIFLHTATHNCHSDLTIRLYSTTSFTSISLKRWLYHQMFKLSYWSVQLCRSKSRDQSYSSLWLVNRLTAYDYRYYEHKYVNIHRHQSFIFSKSIMDNRWQRLSFNAKIARE